MIKHPIRRPIRDPGQQPKAAKPVTQGPGNTVKEPCKFCTKARAIVQKVAASWFNRGAK